MTDRAEGPPAKVTIDLRVPELQPGQQQGGAIDEAALAEWFDRAMRAWQQRQGTQAPHPPSPTAKPASKAKEEEEPTPLDLYRSEKASIMERGPWRRIVDGASDPLGAAGREVRSQIGSRYQALLDQEGPTQSRMAGMARQAEMYKATAGQAWQVAKAGAAGIEFMSAVAPALASSIPGLGGVGNASAANNIYGQAATGLAQGASAFLATIQATANSGMATADAFKQLAEAGILSETLQKDKSLALRIAAREGAKARLAREISGAQTQRIAEGLAEGGGEGALAMAGQMFDAIAANPAKLMGQFMLAAERMWGVASKELLALIWGR